MVGPARPDLAIVDINLGAGMSGIELIERLRELHDLPAIFLTAYSDTATVDRAIRTGSYAFVVKPRSVPSARASSWRCRCRHAAIRSATGRRHARDPRHARGASG